MIYLDIDADPKMLHETLCVAQGAVARHWSGIDRRDEHVARLQRLIDAVEVLRPLGPDGKHGTLHTPWCGCEDAPAADTPDLHGLLSAMSTWLTLATDVRRSGPSDLDLLALREWIDSGCIGEMPVPGDG